MCDEAAAERSACEPEQVAVAETGDDRRAAADRRGPRRDRRGRRRRSRADGGAAFSDAILTTDRWPKRCTLRAGGVTLSAQAKGGGMIQPNMATMLCFVQTDAVVEDPDAALRAAVDASFERITVDGQMSTNDTVLLQATGASGAPLPEGLLEAVLLQLAIEIVADGEGADPGRPDRGRPGPPRRPRPSGSPARSPTRRWSRRRSSAATPTGAGSPRRPAWPWPARTWRRSAPSSIDAAELGADVAEAEIGLRLGRGEHARPRLVLRPRLRVRADQRGVHDVNDERAA